MKKRITLSLIALAGLTVTGGCEFSNLTAGDRAKAIQRAVEPICGVSRDSAPRKGVVNIMLMEGSEDDGIVTCGDGTNHYFDG